MNVQGFFNYFFIHPFFHSFYSVIYWYSILLSHSSYKPLSPADYETVITDFKVSTGGNTNVLGLVVFSVVLGIIVGSLDEKGRALKECIDSLTLAIIEMVRLIIW